MSSIEAIKAAKGEFTGHIEQHKCRAGQCQQRQDLWLAYMATADLWGKEEQCLTRTVPVSSSGTEFV